MSVKKEKLEKISKQIEALIEKTVENGCSEAEALSATMKVEQLLTQYDLTLGEVSQKSDDYDELMVVTKKSTRSHIHFLVTLIGELTGTLGYSINQPNVRDPKTGKKLPKVYAFYGQKKDIKIAEYLYHLLDNAVEHESLKFKFSPEYRFSDINGKTKMTSFTNGLQMRLTERFQEMITLRDKTIAEEYTGTQALVIVNKKKTATEKYEEENGKIKTNTTRVKAGSREAYGAGRNAANKINIYDGVEGNVNKETKKLYNMDYKNVSATDVFDYFYDVEEGFGEPVDVKTISRDLGYDIKNFKNLREILDKMVDSGELKTHSGLYYAFI